MHPAVPPMEKKVSEGMIERKEHRTSGYDNIYFINVIREFVVDTHDGRCLRLEKPLENCSISGDGTIAESESGGPYRVFK